MASPNTQNVLQQWPTPRFEDRILIKPLSLKVGKTPEYGDLYDDQKGFPGWKLVNIVPIDASSVNLVYASDRANQDEYNYVAKYSGDSPAHPVFVRTYVFPRADFQPLPVLTSVDPLFPEYEGTAVILVQQEVRDVEDKNLASLYISVIRVYETVPGPPIVAKQLVDTPLGPVAGTQKTQRVPYGTSVEGSFTKITEQVQSDTITQATKTTVEIDGESYPLITTYDYDPVLNAVTATTRDMVMAGTEYTHSDGDLEQRDIPVDQWKTLRIITRVAPEDLVDRTEYRSTNFQFPAILQGITVSKVSFGSPITEAVKVTPNVRAAINPPTQIRIVTSFHFSEPSPESVYQLVPNDLVYRGVSYSISINNVLNNVTTVTVSGFTSDQYIGLNDSVIFGASYPTASQYIADIGSEKCISSNIDYYKSGIWIKRNEYITLV